jgi:nitrogenase molybdenum-iron protein alpha/beta subunit
MALYAANNILRGLKNYDQNRSGRAGGVIFNSRALGEEDARIRRFCEAVGLPLLESFPRSDLFSQCEGEGKCLVEAYPGSELAKKFEALAERIETQEELYPANPLSDEELEERILGRERKTAASVAAAGWGAALASGAAVASGVAAESSDTIFNDDDDTAADGAGGAASGIPGGKTTLFSKSMVAREPLMGCAFNGAMSITTQIEGCLSIAHGPRSCAHISYQTITSTPRRFLLERGIVLPYTSAPPLVSSDMSEGVMIFGGIEELRVKIAALKKSYPVPASGVPPVDGEPVSGERVFFVLTTCPAGIIGDNIGRVLDLEDEHTKIVPVRTDGNIQGDYLQGILLAYFEIARALIARNVTPIENTVNIVAEKPETYALSGSLAAVKEILDSFGIKINCRFICETRVEDIRGFMRGKLNLLASGDYMGRTIRAFLEKEYGAEFFDDPFPIGFKAAREWVRRLGARFNKGEAEIAAVLADYERRYEAEIARVRPCLAGKRVMIITITQDIDWALQAALDAGMEIAFVGILNYSQESDFTTGLADSIAELVVNYDPKNRSADIERVKPDLLLSPFPSREDLGMVYQDTITYSPEAGFFSGLVLARRWVEIFNMNLQEGWKKDEYLFRKHYA